MYHWDYPIWFSSFEIKINRKLFRKIVRQTDIAYSVILYTFSLDKLLSVKYVTLGIPLIGLLMTVAFIVDNYFPEKTIVSE